MATPFEARSLFAALRLGVGRGTQPLQVKSERFRPDLKPNLEPPFPILGGATSSLFTPLPRPCWGEPHSCLFFPLNEQIQTWEKVPL